MSARVTTQTLPLQHAHLQTPFHLVYTVTPNTSCSWRSPGQLSFMMAVVMWGQEKTGLLQHTVSKQFSETALASMDSSQVHRATKHRMKNQHCAFMCIGQTPVAPYRHANHLGVAVYPSHPLSRMKPWIEIPVLTKPAVTLGYGKSQAVEDRSPHTKGQAIKSKDKAAPYKQK